MSAVSTTTSVSITHSYTCYGRLLTEHRAGASWTALATRAGIPESTLRNRVKQAHQVERLGEISAHSYLRTRGVVLS